MLKQVRVAFKNLALPALSGMCVAAMVGEAFYGLSFTWLPWVIAFVALYWADHLRHRVQFMAYIMDLATAELKTVADATEKNHDDN